MRKTNILRAVGVLSSTTLLSRITGYLRDAVIASFIGTSFYADAFFVAFRIPNMFRRLLGEGALTPAIVPVVSDLKDKDKSIKEQEIKSIISAGFFVLLFITVLGIVLSPLFVKVIAYGFTKKNELYEITVYLNRLMFPYLFFVCMVAIFMGILNAHNHFFAPSFSPVLLNISMTLGLLLFSKFFSLPVLALAYGVLIGGFLQMLLQLPYLKKLDIRPSIGLNLFTESTKAIALMLIPSFFGLAITQINVLVDTLVASFLKEGTVSYLYYADRILEIPIGVIVVSFATAILPMIAETAKKSENDLLRRQFNKVFTLCLIFVLPIMILFISFGKPLLSTLFQRRAFDNISLQETYYALLGYSLGLPFFSFNRVITPLFYAYKKVKDPVRAGFFAMITNISFDIILMPWGQFGLALATSLSALVNSYMLSFYFKKNHFPLEVMGHSGTYIKILSSSILAGIPFFYLQQFFPYNGSFYLKLFYLTIGVSFFFMTYLIFVIIFKVEGIKEALWKIKEKLSR